MIYLHLKDSIMNTYIRLYRKFNILIHPDTTSKSIMQWKTSKAGKIIKI